MLAPKPMRIGDTFRPERGVICLVVAALLGLVALDARADSDGRRLHVKAPGLTDRELTGVLRAEDGTPRGILTGGRTVPVPEPAAHSRPTLTLGAAKVPSFRPDTDTSMRGELGYYATFSPSIAPYKRLVALDAVSVGAGGEPVLVLTETAVVPVVVSEARESQGRDRFVGEVTLDFSEGTRVTFPSVTPRMRILHVRTDPPVELTFERDGAFNFYARIASNPGRPVHVVVLVDGETSHFNQPIPFAPTDVLAHRASRLPPDLEARALALAAEIGASKDLPLKASLDALVEYFRSFVESDEPPRGAGSLYDVLARGGLGICRHRAYAFTITALALGIPTRFVYNEAHAWVEVELPERGGVRIDLGGSTTTVHGLGFEGRPLYEPLEDDPFPKPQAYLESMRRMGRPVRHGASAASTGESPEEGHLRVAVEASELARYRGARSALVVRVEDEAGRSIESLPVELRVESTPPRPLAAGVTDAEGRVRLEFSVPLDLPPGAHTMTLTTPGTDAIRAQRLRF
jgi:transglutaminase-like putative cysteine protease